MQLLDFLIHSTTMKTQLMAYIFFKFPSLPSGINRWCNLIKRQNNKDGFGVSSNNVLYPHHFMEKDIKKSFLRCWMEFATRFFPLTKPTI